MSYTRSVRSTVAVSGSRTVSYPASEHGGTMTVHFTEYEPVTVNVYVETSDFDQAVSNTEDHVDLLTGAVVSMDAAQTLAINESSKKISDKLIDGFYHLINSDLTMQKAENKSQLQAKFAMLMNLSKDMSQKLERMNNDIARLHRHYRKIFSGLDDDLHTRIMHLDQHAFSLSEKVQDQLIISPYKDKTGTSLSSMSEVSGSSNLMVTGRIKEKTLDVLNHISDSIEKTDSFDRSLSSILHSAAGQQSETEYVPVIYCKSNDETGVYGERVFTPDVGRRERIKTHVNNYMISADESRWKKLDESDLENIEHSLLEMIEKESSDSEEAKRIYRQIMDLWQRDKSEIRHI